MYLIFEYLFYLGLIAIVVGLVAFFAAIFDNHWRRLKFGLLATLLGVALIAGPTIYSRNQVIDLGPRMVLTEGEKHITLTGWDRDDYSLLRSHPETIVLQIANDDVTDQTLDFLTGMANLRELDLNDSQITDAGLVKIAKLTGLESLKLRGTKVTDAGVHNYLSRLPNLTGLDLRQTTVSAQTVENWKSQSEGRRVLH